MRGSAEGQRVRSGCALNVYVSIKNVSFLRFNPKKDPFLRCILAEKIGRPRVCAQTPVFVAQRLWRAVAREQVTKLTIPGARENSMPIPKIEPCEKLTNRTQNRIEYFFSTTLQPASVYYYDLYEINRALF